MRGCLVTLGVFVGLVVTVIVGTVIAFRIVYHPIHVRFRLTVEVQDGNAIKSGSSVIDVAYDMAPDDFVNLGGPNTHPTRIGYAPTVDLGAKGLLFLTFVDRLRTPDQIAEMNKQIFCLLEDIGCLAFAAYTPGSTVTTTYSKLRIALNKVLRQSGPRDVSFAVLPKLVRFSDINDPSTLVALSPYELAASFGPGVQLKRVILELTNDPVTPPSQAWPQWLRVKNQNTTFRGYENG